jgi:integrase/recombinase XerC
VSSIRIVDSVPTTAYPPAYVPERGHPLHVWEAGLSPKTKRAYLGDTKDFAHFLGCEPREAVERFLSNGVGYAHELLALWRADMLRRSLAPATINRRVATLRSLARSGRQLGLIQWKIEVRAEPVKRLRDSRGPGTPAVRQMMAACDGSTEIGARNQAALATMFGMGLRRSEVISLDLEDVDLQNRVLWVVGKGRREKEPLTIPTFVELAMAAWIGFRGTWHGPLFIPLDNAADHRGPVTARLTDWGLYKMVVALSTKVGRRTRPHGIRHSAITEALRQTNNDVVRVQKFSRHASADTVLVYLDNLVDAGGAVSELVAGQLGLGDA